MSEAPEESHVTMADFMEKARALNIAVADFDVVKHSLYPQTAESSSVFTIMPVEGGSDLQAKMIRYVGHLRRTELTTRRLEITREKPFEAVERKKYTDVYGRVAIYFSTLEQPVGPEEDKASEWQEWLKSMRSRSRVMNRALHSRFSLSPIRAEPSILDLFGKNARGRYRYGTGPDHAWWYISVKDQMDNVEVIETRDGSILSHWAAGQVVPLSVEPPAGQ